jgi:hypothetical protein
MEKLEAKRVESRLLVGNAGETVGIAFKKDGREIAAFYVLVEEGKERRFEEQAKELFGVFIEEQWIEDRCPGAGEDREHLESVAVIGSAVKPQVKTRAELVKRRNEEGYHIEINKLREKRIMSVTIGEGARIRHAEAILNNLKVFSEDMLSEGIIKELYELS